MINRERPGSIDSARFKEIYDKYQEVAEVVDKHPGANLRVGCGGGLLIQRNADRKFIKAI